MLLRFKSLVVLMLIAATGIASGLDVKQGMVTVKFKPDSRELATALTAGGHVEFERFKALLGRHSGESFIRPSILSALETGTGHKSLKSDDIMSLRRIFVITFEKDVDPVWAARKLSQFDGVEYAEPVPERYLFDYPNDPLYDVQSHLTCIDVQKAWSCVSDSAPVLTAVVDAGFDLGHEDLKNIFYKNPGEMGTDSKGRDKRFNGIDDDGDGLIDDWQGWDFVGASGIGDNNPQGGNSHGTHVSGILGAEINNGIGIAGTGKNLRILPLKCGYDDPSSGSVNKGCEAILFAAMSGAKVINCSWGGYYRSNAEEETIKTAEALGALIVAAAGNDNVVSPAYPASYPGVMSVAATDCKYKADYSNYGPRADISAPGTNVFSTMPNNSYDYKSGTSMATPVVSGIAAMVKSVNRDYDANLIKEIIKCNAYDISEYNSSYNGLIGTGLISASKIFEAHETKSIVIKSYNIYSDTSDNVVYGRKCYIDLDIYCPLGDVDSVTLSFPMKFTQVGNPQFTPTYFSPGPMKSGQVKHFEKAFSFVLNSDIGAGSKVDWAAVVDLYNGVKVTYPLSFIYRPNVMTIDKNNFSVTVANSGCLGYGDFPTEFVGKGISFKNAKYFLSEGGVMAGYDATHFSDVIHDYPGRSKTSGFGNTKTYSEIFSDDTGMWYLEGGFAPIDKSTGCGTEISQKVIQFTDDSLSNCTTFIYDVKNILKTEISGLRLGIFTDLDLGLPGENNTAAFDNETGIVYFRATDTDTLPFIGIGMISPQEQNTYIFNQSYTYGPVNPVNYFGSEVKWNALSSGMTYIAEQTGDVSLLMGGNAQTLQPGASDRFVFVLLGGNNLDDLRKEYYSISSKIESLNISKTERHRVLTGVDPIVAAPNPTADGIINIIANYDINFPTGIKVFDAVGKCVLEASVPSLIEKKNIQLNLGSAAQGRYFIRVKNSAIDITIPVSYFR